MRNTQIRFLFHICKENSYFDLQILEWVKGTVCLVYSDWALLVEIEVVDQRFRVCEGV